MYLLRLNILAFVMSITDFWLLALIRIYVSFAKLKLYVEKS